MESEKMEYKEQYVSDIYKEVIAFANTDGGTILVGVNDAGEPVGLENIDDVYTRITNGIRDAILPDVTLFTKYTLKENGVISIEVGEGAYKPYYLKSKGLKPSGVFVRQGASSVQASEERIRQMIKDADGNSFEIFRSLNQELSFDDTVEIFKKHDMDFDIDKYYSLGIKNSESKLYTNLGLLLSDECVHTVKIAVFSDDKNTIFRDRKEFGGSLFRQLEETFDYLQLCNQNRAEIEGLNRKDYWDYPKEAIREALLNALIHRDYSFSGSIIINVNEKQMEFISIGGLTGGLEMEDICNGISLSRNEKLANIFYRLHFIEAYGTGIRRIFSLYENCAVKPTIAVTPNSFKLTLPNMNIADISQLSQKIGVVEVTPQMYRLLDYVKEIGSVTDMEVQEFLDIKRTRSYLLLREMTEKGLLKVEGRGVNKRYSNVDFAYELKDGSYVLVENKKGRA